MRPDLIVIVSFPAIYFAKNQLQLNNIANGIVKSKRKYSLPTKIGYNHVSFLMEIRFPSPFYAHIPIKQKEKYHNFSFLP